MQPELESLLEAGGFGEVVAAFHLAARHPRRAARLREDLLEDKAGTGAMAEAIGRLLNAGDLCRVCGVELRDPESVRLGIGPQCQRAQRREAPDGHARPA